MSKGITELVKNNSKINLIASSLLQDEDNAQTYKQDQLIGNFFSYIEHFREDINNSQDFDREDIVRNFKN